MKLHQGLRQHFRVDGNGGFVAKRGYSEETAKRVADRQHKTAYKCPICDRWHLGGSK